MGLSHFFRWLRKASVFLLAFSFINLVAAPIVITNITMVPRLSIQIEVGSSNQIQFSTNPTGTNWNVLTNIVATQNPFWFVDHSAPMNERRFYRVLELLPAVGSNLSFIPAGSFTMGDSFDRDQTNALPTHVVNISAFFVDKFETSKEKWMEVYNWAIVHGYSFEPGVDAKALNHPVYDVSWHDALKWCNARSEKEGRVPAYYTDPAHSVVYRSGTNNIQQGWVKWSAGYRLPTEAEWEKAARGGATGRRFPWTDSDTVSHSKANYYGWPFHEDWPYDLSAGQGLHPAFDDRNPNTNPIGYFVPNGYDVYDVSGNLFEWCWDYYGPYSSAIQTDPRGPSTGLARVIRGGCYASIAPGIRVSARMFPTNHKNEAIGFRCILPAGL